MTPDDDELDPSDWLSAQFAEEPPKPATPDAPADVPPPAPASAEPPSPFAAPDPFSFPAQPVPPVAAPPPAAPQQPPATSPAFPPPAHAPVAPQVQQPPVTPPIQQAPPTPPAADAGSGGFQWGLTPGAVTPEPPVTAPAADPFELEQPAVASAPEQFPAQPSATAPDQFASTDPASAPSPFEFGQGTVPAPAEPQSPVPFGQPPVELRNPPEQPLPFGQGPEPVAPDPFPLVPPAAPMFPVEPPTTALPQPTTALPQPGLGVEAVAPAASAESDPTQWFAAPLDPALDGVTEVFEAELVGLSGPAGEGPEASALDDLFGDSQFREFADEPLIPPRPTGAGGGGPASKAPKAAKGERAPIPRNQKILMWVAGGLAAALALVALFALGMKVASITPSPAVLPSSSPSPSASLGVLPIGPVAPGNHHWDELLGGECLAPYESAWQDFYTVVDCTKPHPAQMVYRGTFSDPASSTYPGVEELQKRINLLCTAPTVIDYAAAGAANDIQVAASYAVDADEWDGGNRSYYCFVTRAAGATFTSSIAVPQVATPAPAPTP